MRIAFVGKGGAGKSSVTTLFFLSQIKKHRKIVCFDADLNIHIPSLLGIELASEKSISIQRNSNQIKNFLRGISEKITSIDQMYKTTPPSVGVNLFKLDPDNFILRNYAIRYKSGYVAAVGTYEAEEIGRSCYHTNLSVLENILSFTQLTQDEILITDMVAGIDAFSNTLHKQFDVLMLVIEPNQENILVYEQYLELAKHANIQDRLYVVANKIEDQTDLEFIKSKIPSDKLVGFISKSTELKRIRQLGKPLDTEFLRNLDTNVFEDIYDIAKANQLDPNIRLKQLHQLHLSYIKQDYVTNAVGDISGQIDSNFSF